MVLRTEFTSEVHPTSVSLTRLTTDLMIKFVVQLYNHVYWGGGNGAPKRTAL